jgi:hypothetical protein
MSDKDQYPHTDVANNEEGGPPGQVEHDRAKAPPGRRDDAVRDRTAETDKSADEPPPAPGSRR